MVTRVFLLFGFYASIHRSFVLGESVEVALDADGLVISENRPLKAATDFSTGEHRVQVSKPTAIPPELHSEGLKLNEPPKGSDVGVVAMLQQELAAVEQMIKLQEKRLQVLQEMRAQWLEDHETEVYQDDEEQKRTRVNVMEHIDRKVNVGIEVATMSLFDTFFVEKISLPLEKDVVDMTTIVLGTVQLTALAYRNNEVIFYTTRMKELLRLKTEKQMIERIALEWQDDQPCLIVAFETSQIAIYELKLTFKSIDIVADTPESLNSNPDREKALTVGRVRNFQMSSKTSSLSTARSSRQLVVAVAQIDGSIEFLALNGTKLRQISTNASISAIDMRRNRLAFSDRSEIIVSVMTRASGSVFYTCSGSAANVTSIAFDVVEPEIMYVGTQRGEILVYAVNAGTTAEALPCRLLSRSFVSKTTESTSSVVLVPTEMYVIAAGGQEVVVFNISRTQKSVSLVHLCSTRLPLTQSGSQTLPQISYSEGMSGAYLTIISRNQEGRDRMTIYHSLLVNEREALDYRWTIYLYGLGVVAFVVGTQIFYQCQKQANVNPWTSIGNARDARFGHYRGQNYIDKASEQNQDGLRQFNSLSDDLQGRIAREKRVKGRAIDDDFDY